MALKDMVGAIINRIAGLSVDPSSPTPTEAVSKPALAKSDN